MQITSGSYIRRAIQMSARRIDEIGARARTASVAAIYTEISLTNVGITPSSFYVRICLCVREVVRGYLYPHARTRDRSAEIFSLALYCSFALAVARLLRSLAVRGLESRCCPSVVVLLKNLTARSRAAAADRLYLALAFDFSRCWKVLAIFFPLSFCSWDRMEDSGNCVTIAMTS